MNNFKRYLSSYLLILLLPIIVLSVVISYIILDFCKNQLVEQKLSALRQLETVIQIQQMQLNSYAVQTVSNTHFFSRNQRMAGDMYRVKSTLQQWMNSNTFIDDVSYYNTILDKIYCYNAVYKVEDYPQWHAGEKYKLSEETLRDILYSDIPCQWVGDTENGQILYFTSARISSREKSWLIFEISHSVLDTLITKSNIYDNESTCICLPDGTVLYTTDFSLNPREILAQDSASGEIQINGQMVIYTLVHDYDLVYVNIIPKNVIKIPLWGLWRAFYLGLLLIAFLGWGIIFWMMRVNYLPIHKLENTVFDAQVLDAPGKDAVSNVSQAFHKITLRTNRLAKDRVVFRLLMGTYRTVADFNHDAAPLGLHLKEDSLFIIDVKNLSVQDAEACSRISKIGCAQKENHSVLSLEIPERQEIIFIRSGMPAPDESQRLEIIMKEHGLCIKAYVSEVCVQTEQLSKVWNNLYSSRLQPDDLDAGTPSQELCSILSNALAFEEPNRIQFALESMCTSLESANVLDVRTWLLDVLYLTRCRCADNNQVALQLDGLYTDISAISGKDKGKAKQLLRMIGNIVCNYLGSPEEDGAGTLCYEMEAFLAANYTNPDLTVQNIADIYGLSLSNLSHYFKSHVGISVSGYIENLRITQARQLLQNTDMKVTDISNAVGYTQSSTFMRAFKKLTGISPSAWRTEHKKG